MNKWSYTFSFVLPLTIFNDCAIPSREWIAHYLLEPSSIFSWIFMVFTFFPSLSLLNKQTNKKHCTGCDPVYLRENFHQHLKTTILLSPAHDYGNTPSVYYQPELLNIFCTQLASSFPLASNLVVSNTNIQSPHCPILTSVLTQQSYMLELQSNIWTYL